MANIGLLAHSVLPKSGEKHKLPIEDNVVKKKKTDDGEIKSISPSGNKKD